MLLVSEFNYIFAFRKTVNMLRIELNTKESHGLDLIMDHAGCGGMSYY